MTEGSMKATPLESFMDAYARNLEKAVREYPDEYTWPIDRLPVVLERMKSAIIRGSFNKDGRAFKATCKELGIGYTYRDIKAYISEA